VSPLPGEVAPPWPPASRGWRAVAIFCVAAILSYTDRQILSLLVDPIRHDLRISDTEVSLLQGVAFAVIYAFAGLPLGRLADTLPRRTVILAGVLVWSVATAACGLATTFGTLFAARVGVGIGEAALAPAAISIIADSFPPARRGAATGVFLMGMVMGGGAAITLGGALLQAAQDSAFRGLPVVGGLAPWRATLVLLGLPGLAVAALLLLVREPERRSRLAKSGVPSLKLRASLAQLWALSPALGPLYLALALTSVTDFTLLNWTPALLMRKFGFSAGDVAGTLGLATLAAGIVGATSGGLASDRVARGRTAAARLPVSLAATVVGIVGAGLGFAPSGWLVVALFALWFTMSSVAGAAGVTAVQEIAPNEMRGLSVALISFGNILLGLGGGPTLAALLTDHLYRDPAKVGLSISTVAAPAALAAVILFYLAIRGAGRLKEDLG
jgi:MFS family permease